MSKVKLTINKDLCIGCGLCVMSLPEAFSFDESENKSYVKPRAEEAPLEKLKEVVQMCPVGAITIEE